MSKKTFYTRTKEVMLENNCTYSEAMSFLGKRSAAVRKLNAKRKQDNDKINAFKPVVKKPIQLTFECLM